MGCCDTNMPKLGVLGGKRDNRARSNSASQWTIDERRRSRNGRQRRSIGRKNNEMGCTQR